MPRSAKRRKTRLRAKPFLVVALVLNIAVGMCFSPLTNIRTVRVEGAQDFDRARLTSAVQMLRDKPCLRVNPRGLESDVLDLPEARTATLSRTIFGKGVLRIAYRTPVARFEGSKRLALSDDGVVYAADTLNPLLPILQVPKSLLEPNLTLEGFWEPARVAQVALQARTINANEEEHILITQAGRVTLSIGQGRVVLGNCENLEQKFKALGDRLARKPLELSQIAELDLTLPSRPTIRQLNRGNAP